MGAWTLSSTGADTATGVGTAAIVATWVAVLVMLLAAVAVDLVRARRQRRATPRQVRRARTQPATSATHGMQLVAVEAVDGTLALDGIVADDDDAIAPRGWPITLRLRRPDTPFLDEAVTRLLRGWAEKDDVVRFAITRAGRGGCVAITHGPSILRFDPDLGGPRPDASGFGLN